MYLRHLKEHMEIPRDVGEMSPEELMFYYFRMYDADQNTKGRPIQINIISKPHTSELNIYKRSDEYDLLNYRQRFILLDLP